MPNITVEGVRNLSHSFRNMLAVKKACDEAQVYNCY